MGFYVIIFFAILVNLLFLAIDPILAGIFLLIWPAWVMFHREELQ